MNDESRFKWILKHLFNLPDAGLDKSLDILNIANQSLANTMGEIQFENF